MPRAKSSPADRDRSRGNGDPDLSRPSYAPRPHQADLARNLKRFNVLVCHRRFGKTVMCVNQLIERALTTRLARPRFAYVAPLYRQAKQAAWDYLKHYTEGLEDRSVHETELRVDIGEARIQLFGSDRPDSLRGIYLDGVILDEFALMRPRVWSEVIRPALADRGGMAVFIGTPKGRNSFCELYERAKSGEAGADWFAALQRASETGILPEVELRAARDVMTDEEYAQEFECSFQAAVAGAYFGKLLEEAERDGRVGRCPADPSRPVHTAWDLGIGDSTAIWFLQQIGPEIRWVDYYEASGVGLEHYVKVLRDRPYVYGDHLLPHDAEARELGSGRTRVETLATLGIRVRVIARHSIEDGINAVRLLIPRSWFDATKCKRGLDALRQYRREWNDRGGLYRPRPLHDWTSHAADAARYAALGLREERDFGADERPDRAETDYVIWRH